MRLYVRVFLVILGSSIGRGSAAAQRVEDLPRGAKVRMVMNGGGKAAGYVDTVTIETISLHSFIKNPEGDRLELRRDRVTQMQVWKKTPGKGVARGALLGLLIGAGSFFVIGALTYSDSDCDILACSPESAGAFASIWGAVIGVPVGMMWGASRQAWQDVAVHRQ